MRKFLNQIKNNQFSFWPLQIFGWGLMFSVDFSLYLLECSETKVFSANKFDRILTFNITGLILTSLLRYVYQGLRKKSLSLLSTFFSVLGFSFIVANIWLALSWYLFIYFNITKWKLSFILYGSYTYHFSSYILAWSALYFGIKYWQDFQMQKEQTLKATALAHKAQLQMLRYQLNPHFLFNALNSVRAMIKENHEYARKMISEISEFLRYTLVNVDVSEVLLKDEINAIQNYLSIEKIRYEDELEVGFNIEKSAENVKIPGFLIHPLVENAIKHGMRTSPIPLRIEINAQSVNGTLEIDVLNTGDLSDTTEVMNDENNDTGTGLQNIRKRLEQLFPDKHTFEVYQKNGWVHAKVIIEMGNK